MVTLSGRLACDGQRGLAVGALDLRSRPACTLTSTMRQQRHRPAVRRAHGERGDVLDAELLGAGEAHPHRHFGFAAAELAQRRAAQCQADELRHLLRAEAERRRPLAIDADRATRCSVSPMSTRTSRSSLRLARIGTRSSAELGQRLRSSRRPGTPAPSARGRHRPDRRCRPTPIVARADLGSSLLIVSTSGLVDAGVVVEGEPRAAPSPARCTRSRSARCGSACGWRRGTSRRAAPRPTSAPWCSCRSTGSRARSRCRRRRRTCSSWSASSARC